MTIKKFLLIMLYGVLGFIAISFVAILIALPSILSDVYKNNNFLFLYIPFFVLPLSYVIGLVIYWEISDR